MQDDAERLRRALLALERMRNMVEAGRQAQSEPVAIIGIGCRFPGGADSAESYWRMLRAGVDAVTEVPAERWDIDAYYVGTPGVSGRMCSRFGGFLERVNHFDPLFFGIAPREAEDMDPQQFLVLETAWEAIEDAGIDIARLFRSTTGVFLGAGTVDFALRRLADPSGRAAVGRHFGTGSALSVIAGRLSYALGLFGPCLSLDTACSSSLVSVHLACNSLRLRECDQALAGGVSVLLDPAPSVNFSQARMLAPDGRCRSFDAAASGYVRGEGCGVVMLKRLSDAQRDGDRVIALILGSAVNHDGPSAGLTVPNGPAQQAVITEALRRAQVKPDQVGYVECHGTGTPLGDPIEVEALGGVFGKERHRDLLIGSVKTNIGHLEVAAGIAGLIKAALSVAHGQVAPQLHFRTPNPRIGWERLPFRVPVASEEWPVAGRRIAGVSGFGFSGTNAHIVLADYRQDEASAPEIAASVPSLLFLSAKTATALQSMAARHAGFLAAHPELALGDVAWSLATGRMRMPHWLVVAATTMAEAIDRLTRWAQGETVAAVLVGKGREVAARDGMVAPRIEAALRRVEALLLGGETVDWAAVLPPGRRVALPTYPFERQIFSLGPAPLPPDLADPAQTASDDSCHLLLGKRLALAGSRDQRFEARLSLARAPFLGDHRVFGQVLLPATCFIEMALAAARLTLAADCIALEDVVLRHPLIVPERGTIVVQTVLTSNGVGSFDVECFSRASGGAVVDPTSWTLHFSTKLQRAETVPGLLDEPVATRSADCGAFYDAYGKAGIAYGPRFRVISALGRGELVASADLSPPAGTSQADRFAFDPRLLDGGFQLLGAAFAPAAPMALHLPVGIRRLVIRVTDANQLRGQCRVRIDGAERRADVTLVDQLGEPVAALTDIVLLPADADALRQVSVRPSVRAAPSNGGAERGAAVSLAALSTLVGAILHIDVARIDPAAPLTTLGIDSMMALDLRDRARAELRCDIPLAALIGGDSIAALIERFAGASALAAASTIVEGEL